jgi:hypothetical protein
MLGFNSHKNKWTSIKLSRDDSLNVSLPKNNDLSKESTLKLVNEKLDLIKNKKWYSKNLIDNVTIKPDEKITSSNLDLNNLGGKNLHVYVKCDSKVSIVINQSFDDITYYLCDEIIKVENNKHIILNNVSKFVNFTVKNKDSEAITLSLDTALFA